MWVEITVPRINFELTKPWSQASSWIRDSEGLAKLYYSQVYWASDVRSIDGHTEYLLSEKYGALPDYYWVDARACRPITAEESRSIQRLAINAFLSIFRLKRYMPLKAPMKFTSAKSQPAMSAMVNGSLHQKPHPSGGKWYLST
jgi:hypothetical protein